MSRESKHPWRTRTRAFAAHLDTLPPSEREQIQRAERDYLAQREEWSSLQSRAMYEFAIVMVGAREEDVDTEQ